MGKVDREREFDDAGWELPPGVTERLPETLAEAHAEIIRLRQEVHLDELTELPNRRYFKEELTRRTAAAERERLSVSVLMIDLKDLSGINNSVGHDIGDHVLRKFSQLLVETCRDTDMVARIGGDELAVMLDGSEVGPFLDRFDEGLDEEDIFLPKPGDYYLGCGLYEGSGEQDPRRIEDKRRACFREAQRNLSADKRRQKGI